MARIRSDKPEAYQSETLAEISLAAERTFKGMATIADDRGRLADKPAQINGELWSMRGSHSRDDLEAELGEMVRVGLVCRYTGCDGKRYLHMVSWDRHQKIDRPSKSRVPRCPRHPGGPDDCGGGHDGDCKPAEDSWTIDTSSRESREGSRVLQPAESGLDAVADADGPAREDVPPPVDMDCGRVNGHPATQPPDQQEQESSRDCREPSMLDRGSRTLDRGSRTLDLKQPSRTGARETPPTILGSTLLDEHVKSCRASPPRDVIGSLGERIDRLLDEGQNPDTIRRGLTALRLKPNLGPGALPSLVNEIIQGGSPDLPRQRANGSRRTHQPFQNPADDSVYEELI